jgi:hypothetical protein
MGAAADDGEEAYRSIPFFGEAAHRIDRVGGAKERPPVGSQRQLRAGWLRILLVAVIAAATFGVVVVGPRLVAATPDQTGAADPLALATRSAPPSADPPLPTASVGPPVYPHRHQPPARSPRRGRQ